MSESSQTNNEIFEGEMRPDDDERAAYLVVCDRCSLTARFDDRDTSRFPRPWAAEYAIDERRSHSELGSDHEVKIIRESDGGDGSNDEER